jgi:CheY-like chemotaxis protein
VLRLSGYDVTTAFSGSEALEAALRLRPHAVLLDIGMPGMNGFEVAHQIRLQAWGRRAVLIALTGWGQADDKLQARAAGFDEHLTKPVDPGDVENILARMLAGGAQDSDQTADSQRRDG